MNAPAGHNGRRTSADFVRLQAEHFAHADADKYFWQTGNPYVARTERELLKQVPLNGAERLLEVGCGEGGNLHLMGPGRMKAIGLDVSREKVAWAFRQLPQARFVCGDATRLPFRDGAFDVVLCRDVLHHVADKPAVAHELFRVCRAGGTIVVIEPNGRSPIMHVLGWVVPAERDLTRNSVQRLVPLFRSDWVTDLEVIRAQPFPVGRVLFHYRWGWPRLSSWLSEFVLALERLAGRVLPADRWAYLIFRTTRRGTPSAPEVRRPEVSCP
ncbi:MAG: class I SAM-dependent methyltransferase [Nitrospirales bacterium]